MSQAQAGRTKTLHNAKPQAMRALQVGERVRLDESDPEVWECTRVSPGAAYLRRAATRQVRIVDPRTEEERSFEAHESRTIAVSVHAFVIRD